MHSSLISIRVKIRGKNEGEKNPLYSLTDSNPTTKGVVGGGEDLCSIDMDVNTKISKLSIAHGIFKLLH